MTCQAYWFLRQFRNRAVKDGKCKWEIMRIERRIKEVLEALYNALNEEADKRAA
jgi:hypothetical protein